MVLQQDGRVDKAKAVETPDEWTHYAANQFKAC